MSQTNISNLERLGSIAAGSALITSSIMSVFSRPYGAVVKLLAGGLLIYRGGSGYCPINAALGINNAEASMATPTRDYYPENPTEDDYPQASEQAY